MDNMDDYGLSLLFEPVKDFKHSHSEQSEETDDCPICLESLSVNIKAMRLDCNHKTHLNCIGTMLLHLKKKDRWEPTTPLRCPTCRAEVSPEKIEYILASNAAAAATTTTDLEQSNDSIPDICPYCARSISVMWRIRLECHHSMHLHCIRKKLRSLRRRQPHILRYEDRLRCPTCHEEVSHEEIANIASESRNLRFSHTLPLESVKPETRLRVMVVAGREEYIEGETFRVEDLPVVNGESRAVLSVNMDVRVQEPHNKNVSAWVVNVDTHERISIRYRVKMTAVDHDSEEEEEMSMERLLRGLERVCLLARFVDILETNLTRK